MSKVPQKSFSDLIDQMKGQNSLVDYDVLVSYKEDAVNKILAARAKEIGALDEYTDVIHTTDDFGDNITKTLKITFKTISLKFPDSNGNVYIYIPFKGSRTVTSDDDPTKTNTITFDKVQLYFKTLLKSIRGRVESGDLSYSKGATKHNAGEAVVLESDKEVTQGVFIDFPDDINIKMENIDGGTASSDDLTKLKNTLEQPVKDRLEKLGFHFHVAATNNKVTKLAYQETGSTSSSSSTSVELQPKTFSFLTVAGQSTGSKTAALCTWIVLKGNENQGNKDAQAFSPGPDRTIVNPIPRNSDASIIFSHRVMANLFLLPGLRTTFDNVHCDSITGQNGMSFTFNFRSIEISIPAYEERDGNNYLLHIDGCKFNLNSPKATAKIVPDNTDTPLSLFWTSDTQKINWSETWSTGVSQGGTLDLQFTLKGSAKWKASDDTSAHPNRIGLDFSFDPSFGVSVKAESQSFWDRVFGGSESIPQHMKDVHPETPTISIEVKPMDYFLTTNLLYPKKHLFLADDPSKPGEKGMATPRDTIITGGVKSDL